MLPTYLFISSFLFLISGGCGQSQFTKDANGGTLVAKIRENRFSSDEVFASSLVAAESLQNQRTAFMSAILLYLNKPEDGATEATIADYAVPIKNPRQDSGILGRVLGAWSDRNETEFNQVTGRSLSRSLETSNVDESLNHVSLSNKRRYFRHDDQELNIRVLRSVTGAEERRAHDSWPGPPSWITDERKTADWGTFPEFLLKDTLGSQKTVMVEEVQEKTPFNRSLDGELIMRDLPMVERRSIPQFGGMVTLYTRTSPLRLLYYGNWCGSGGMGPALDAIDHCCMDHDHCYGHVQRKSCIAFQKPYTIHYSWRWDDKRQQAYCLRTGDRCADLTCDCDRVAAACFSRHMINSRLEGNRLRKHRPSRPFRH